MNAKIDLFVSLMNVLTKQSSHNAALSMSCTTHYPARRQKVVPHGGPVILLFYAPSTWKDHIPIHKWPQELIHCRTERYNMGKKDLHNS